jgi:hypothetical protein
MGRTMLLFRIALEMEKEEWKPFCNALSKSDREECDEMFSYTLLTLKRLNSPLSPF